MIFSRKTNILWCFCKQSYDLTLNFQLPPQCCIDFHAHLRAHLQKFNIVGKEVIFQNIFLQNEYFERFL